ncbi:response regulator [Gilvimarinus sp. F26214L]|uniref:response regulator n=1 Tax=Gilvimarinus sp. DZF01 TaxID=3461371 RepID=UPI004045229B
MTQDTTETPMVVHQVNILLVDDKPERLLSYEVALGRLGHNLVRAHSGTEALSLLMKMEFAAILLDVSMPVMDGFETAALIRDHPRFEETPIIFVTGIHITDLDRRRGYEMGAVDYVQIPVIPEILRGKVRALVQLYLQRAELSRLNDELADANSELARAHEELKAKNTRELEKLNANLEQANTELKATNSKLMAEIAEREKVEEELFKSAQRKDEYIAILAHELRNPLSAIHNAVQVMQMDQVSEQQISWARELLQRQVNHLTYLMDDLLDVSRISNGRIELRLEAVELATVLAQARETVASIVSEHEHRLEIIQPDEPLWVQGDLVRLTQVLGNLLTNAAKYMENGGLIQVTLEKEGNHWARIRVRDHGVGIPKELLDSLFDLFVQAPTALNRAQGGLGIGLALVRALVDLHGGTTHVRSEGEGRGAEFSVRLPLLEVLESQGPEPDTSGCMDAETAEVAGGARPVVIIDDNEDSAGALAICLETLGYDVQVSHTGESGLTLVRACNPDVVLLDIGLPDINGYQVAEQLRAEETSDSSLRIIAMSGYGGASDQRRALEAGFDHYLVKPVDYGRLMELLSEEVAPSEAL